MISEENKLKFIKQDIVLLPSGTTIEGKYECPFDWEFGSILKYSDKLFKQHSNVLIKFGSGYELFLSEPYKFKPAFMYRADEVAFNRLNKTNRDQIIEYCDWIASEEGKVFVKRIGNIKVFV